MRDNENRMSRKTNNHPERPDKEDLGFLDDRMQLLDTVRQMIDVELERRRSGSEEISHPEQPPPESKGRKPSDCRSSCHTLWQRIVSFFQRLPTYI